MARKLAAAWATLLVLGHLAVAAEAPVALAIVYDTSGSMRDPVRDVAGKGVPKYTIGNRALLAVIDQLQEFAQQNHNQLSVGLVVFDDRSAREAFPFGRFDAGELRHWAKSFISPHGPTPLGPALQVAVEALAKTDATQRHILVITDGENTAGPDPVSIMRELQEKKHLIAFHFVAFDVNAKAFSSIKELGATVVSAADEKELNKQLKFILEEKILLEK